MNEITSEQAQTSWRADRLERLEQLASEIDPVRVAVVCPQDEPSLTGALESQKRGLIEAVLVCLVAAAKRAGDKTHV